MPTRRRFLQATLALPLLSALAGATRQRLLPVQVSPERIIRRVVGLRPYRSAGFVVKAQSLDDKLVIHNYGHGGAGITLSWGTSHLAVELAWQTEAREFAVLGCGAVGLATARLLQRRGAQVTIYARDLPPNTTSNIAGGQWGPAWVGDLARKDPAWTRQFSEACRISNRAFQDLVGDEYGVHWLDNYRLYRKPGSIEPMFPEARDVADFSPEQSPFPGLYARRFTTLMIQPSTYLPKMMEDVLRFGGKIVVADFPEAAALAGLPQPVAINCTGLGSRELFGDQELIPVKGQLSVLLPQPEIDYAYIMSGGLYMFPRQDGILLGGTHEHGVSSLEPDLEAEKTILAGHQTLAQSLDDRKSTPPRANPTQL